MVCTQLRYINWKSQRTAIFNIAANSKIWPWVESRFWNGLIGNPAPQIFILSWAMLVWLPLQSITVWPVWGYFLNHRQSRLPELIWNKRDNYTTVSPSIYNLQIRHKCFLSKYECFSDHPLKLWNTHVALQKVILKSNHVISPPYGS